MTGCPDLSSSFPIPEIQLFDTGVMHVYSLKIYTLGFL